MPGGRNRSLGRSVDRLFGRSIGRPALRFTLSGVFILTFALAVPSAAEAQNSHLQGFGGVTFGDVTNSTTFGGGVAVPLTDNLHVIAEGGRMTDLMTSLLGTVFDVVPVDVRVAAWYGEAGVRLIASSTRALRPYAEATGGFARMRVRPA